VNRSCASQSATDSASGDPGMTPVNKAMENGLPQLSKARRIHRVPQERGTATPIRMGGQIIMGVYHGSKG